MATQSITVPLDTIVPISKFGRAGASGEFAKVEDDTPVTVLRNGEPAYFIINAHDYRIYRQALIDAENRQARHEALNGIGKRFGSVDDLMADLDA